jgi:PHD/YefM family antitoxin component YafN of YafNO toxin-antitoxin module
MANNLSMGSLLDMLIPISRFNNGGASKIFDEVRMSGCKVVVQNNVPACILLTPERYQEMVDEIEDSKLYALAASRLENDIGATVSFERILAKDGLTLADIEKMEDVEIE